MKALVETIGGVLLLTQRNEIVPFNRPAVIVNDTWMPTQIALGQLTLLSLLPDAATEHEWMTHLKACDGNRDLAVASYIAMFETPAKVTLDPAPAPAPAPAPVPTPPPEK